MNRASHRIPGVFGLAGAALLGACFSSGANDTADGGSGAQADGGGGGTQDGSGAHDGSVSMGCVPKTCTSPAASCGMIPDGCGGMLSCGGCTAPETCGGGGTADVCGVGTCTPTTCAAAGADCGSISDGCGNLLTCGACTAPATCGGGAGANVCGGGSASEGGPPGSVTFTIDVSKGPNRVFNPPSAPVPVSPYIYGVNSFAAWEQTTAWGMLRWGGDGMTDWNWTNNFTNSASDFCFWQGNEGGGTTLAGTVTTGTPSVVTDQKSGVASLVTVPILDFVASSAVTNNVWSGSTPPCPGTPTCSSGGGNGTAMNVADLDFASTDPSSKAFVANHAAKGSAFCTATTATTGTCSVDTAGAVYEDEFVNYMKVTYGTGAPVFFMLDNEPNYWPSTHPEVYASTGTPGCGTSGTVTFDDIVTRNTTYATAIKNAWPDAKVFGPVVAQDGIIYAGDYNDPNLPMPFAKYYLAHMAAASSTAGHALIDSFDTHYYTSNGMDGNGSAPSGAQCLQAPRLFWDPNFTEYTESQTSAIDFGYDNSVIDSTVYPREMIPRVLGWIANAYAGNAAMAPGFSISEYDMGCEAQIEGGVAQADLLGVFGREGLFGATMWPLKTVASTDGKTLENYPVAAFDLYRNYDGSGGSVGDTAVYATTSDVPDTSVYAFTSSSQAGEVDVVAINKLASPTTVTLSIAHAPSLTKVSLYNLVNGTIGVSTVSGPPSVSCSGGSCTINYTMPATSATTLVLR